MEKELKAIKWIIVMIACGLVALYIIWQLNENENRKIEYYKQQQERLLK